MAQRRSSRNTNNSASVSYEQQDMDDNAIADVSTHDDVVQDQDIELPDNDKDDDGEYQPEGDDDDDNYNDPDAMEEDDEEEEEGAEEKSDDKTKENEPIKEETESESTNNDTTPKESTPSTIQRKKFPAPRRQKHSNLNAVNRKRQFTPGGPDDDLDENSPPVANDEFITPSDPNGDKKISPLGVLLGGRQFRVKTFKVPGRGDRMYAISTDVARLVGYRDSYFLFQKHTNLYRVRIDEESKMSLINDGYLPGTFKTRAAYLITARSAYKEFGARIINEGRQVLDDYYEEQARKEGAIEGALINPVLSNDGYNNSITDNQSLFDKQRNIAQLLSNTNILETETSWVYDHALKCRQFDSMLFYDRNELLKRQVQRDLYTNLNFVPDITQPTKSKIRKLKSNTEDTKNKLIFDTVIGGSTKVRTGLSDVPLEIFDGCVSEEIKEAILEQQKLESII